jgi:hypothetical protein
MRSPFIAIVLLGVGMGSGWLLADLKGRSPAKTQERGQLVEPLVDSRDEPDKTDVSLPVAWETESIDVQDLEGLHLLGGRSPVPDMALWLGPDPADPGFEALTEWLDFGVGQKEALSRILLESANSLIKWERTAVKVEEVAKHQFAIHWAPPPPNHRRALQQKIHDSFGEALGRSIWLKGDLERFGRLDPRIVPGGEASFQVVLSPGASAGTLKLTLNRGSDYSQVYRAPGKLDDAFNPSFAMAYRLAHLIDLEQAAREMVPGTGPANHPFATPAGTPGMVISPVSGKIIDVTGIPAGSLVRDPTVPEGGFFRVPPEAVED